MVGTLWARGAMEPENEKPAAAESRAVAPKAVDPMGREPRAADPAIVDRKAGEPGSVDAKIADAKIVDVKIADSNIVPPNPVRGRMNERRFAHTSRRELLKLAPVLALGAFAIPRFQNSLLNQGLGFSDGASAWLFRRSHLAPTFADAELTPFEKFPINGYDVDDPGVIFENWTLTVSGGVQKPGEYKLAQIQALPRVRQNTLHVCVEGWDVVGRFGGARLSDFLNMIGADTSARFLTLTCADDYYESLDMATALHPQTLLCYEMYDRPLTREHGAPLRLNVPTKVGYKQAKYLTALKVTNVLHRVGYWEDQGYSSFYGL
jgi:DMSO/TMAO reductase YedYZ molybdopterin-dependent catalytic subunit